MTASFSALMQPPAEWIDDFTVDHFAHDYNVFFGPIGATVGGGQLVADNNGAFWCHPAEDSQGPTTDATMDIVDVSTLAGAQMGVTDPNGQYGIGVDIGGTHDVGGTFLGTAGGYVIYGPIGLDLAAVPPVACPGGALVLRVQVTDTDLIVSINGTPTTFSLAALAAALLSATGLALVDMTGPLDKLQPYAALWATQNPSTGVTHHVTATLWEHSTHGSPDMPPWPYHDPSLAAQHGPVGIQRHG